MTFSPFLCLNEEIMQCFFVNGAKIVFKAFRYNKSLKQKKERNGNDTLIGEGGGTLSGGEKQRISIARAILKNAPIIILDEATSSVDPENEEELQRAIAELTHDKTIIMIAHRLKTVRGADQILVLDDSHIVQSGTHAELIQQKGLYADFVSAKQEAIGWKLAQ